jgi:hypothetical protein
MAYASPAAADAPQFQHGKPDNNQPYDPNTI